MYYWKALVYLNTELAVGEPTAMPLDRLTNAIGCTRRNAQLLVKKLSAEGVIYWQPAAGRGRLPSITMLQDIEPMLASQAQSWLAEGKIEAALTLVTPSQRQAFLANYLQRYATPSAAGDVLQIPFYRATHDLDPINITRRTESHLANSLYAKVLKWDVNSGRYLGDLAQRFERVGDALNITLRKDLRFHNGAPILAQSIADHLHRLLDHSEHYCNLYQLIDGIDIHDDYRFSVRSQSAANLLPKLLANGPMGITQIDAGRVIGSGPFQLVEQTQWRTLLRVSSHYHGYRPWVDGIEVWNVGDNAKDFAANSHLFHPLAQQAKSKRDYESKVQWERGCEYVTVNANRPWGHSLKQRQALMTIVRALALPAQFREGFAGANGMMSAPAALAVIDSERAQQAAQLLTNRLAPLQLLTYQLNNHIEYAQHLQSGFQQLGIACQLKVLPFPEFNRSTSFAQADMVISGEVFEEDVDLAWLDWLLSSLNLQSNLTAKQRQWLQQQLTKLYPLDEAQRLPAYQQLEKKLIDKAVYQPIFHVQQRLNYADSVSMTDLLANGWVDFSEVVLQR
ncbi:ABC transporter [Saccharospirillum sp. MSK14-1]|uniref:ABC transporter substrate-binding protein n=1 Tax=Saccharospirillum sp. MSK14-1 TaxID=1897632 RepID=UPI000D3A8C67|nr:ABC transporter substrate-binding protein [Saccharospirillum sp. MSK14-1]PTY38452.1 ABC transporter [Saccharospirillum sp. MSK14-1]